MPDNFKPAAGLAAALFLSTCVAGPAWASDDSVIRYRIEERLKEGKVDGAGDVHVRVDQGKATLAGMVTTVDARRRAEKAALKEATAVENRLRVVPERPRDDAALRVAVLDTLLRYPQTSIFDDVAFSVRDGAVTLYGSVHKPYRRNDLEARVARVAGVRAIENKMEVQPVSLFDDEIRAQLAREIYGSGRFVHYQNRVNPPVRIVVNNGRVTLTGVVLSRVDQVLLGSIARNSPAFAVDNRLVVESERPKEPARSGASGTLI